MAYGKVHETFWDDHRLQQLAEQNEDTRWLLLYFITCRHKNRLGCFVLDPRYAAADLGWPVDRVNAALGLLISAGRVAYDPKVRVVFVRHFLRHNTLENHKVVTGAVAELASIPKTDLLPALLVALEENRRPHYVPLIEALRNRLGNGMPNDTPDPPDTVADTVCHTVAPPIPSPSLTLTKGTDANASGDGVAVSFPQSRSGELTDGDLMALVREHFYAPDGKPPTHYNEGREFGIFKALVEKGRKTRNEIADAIEGAALIRDDAGRVGDQVVDWLHKGDKMTMRVLYHTSSGITPFFQLALQKLAESRKRAKAPKSAWNGKGAVDAQAIMQALNA